MGVNRLGDVSLTIARNSLRVEWISLVNARWIAATVKDYTVIIAVYQPSRTDTMNQFREPIAIKIARARNSSFRTRNCWLLCYSDANIIAAVSSEV